MPPFQPVSNNWYISFLLYYVLSYLFKIASTAGAPIPTSVKQLVYQLFTVLCAVLSMYKISSTAGAPIPTSVKQLVYQLFTVLCAVLSV